MRSYAPITAAGALLAAATLGACSAAQGRGGLTTARRYSPVPVGAAALGLPSAAVKPCGPATPETIAQAAGLVARRIYAGELASFEVFKDKAQVESYSPLLSALASGDRAAAKEAVTSLVYSHTHVVRLRVIRGGEVLADVGGPEILAPVSGRLRRGGRTLGGYVLSVQDDLGYVKLVSRFIGARLVLRAGSHTLPVAGTLSPAPASIPTHGAVRIGNQSYQAFSFNGKAFPSAGLRISLLIPLSGTQSRDSCSAVKAAELSNVAQRIARRFTLAPANFSSYIKTAGPMTGSLIYVRSGARQLAGSTHTGPRSLPTQGTAKYRGTTYAVSSFSAPTEIGQARIYVLSRQ